MAYEEPDNKLDSTTDLQQAFLRVFSVAVAIVLVGIIMLFYASLILIAYWASGHFMDVPDIIRLALSFVVVTTAIASPLLFLKKG